MRALIIKVVEIDAICDIKEETADSAVPEFGGKKYASYQQMLEREELDAVHVAVPTFAHYDAEVLAAQKGIHLFLEKPIAQDVGNPGNDTTSQYNFLCWVSNTVYWTYIQQAKSFLQGRTVGMAIIHRWGGLPGTPWWQVIAQSGGQLVEQTTHQIDLLRYLVGEVEEVHAYYALRTLNGVEYLDVPNVYALTLKFENSAIGVRSVPVVLRKRGWE